MTILSTHESSRIRNAALSALHYIAFDQHCEVSDILALITPSQPPSQAPAARMSEEATSGMQADDTAPQSSADLSAAPAATPIKPTGPQAKHAAEASTEPMDAGGVQDRCESTPPTPSKPQPTSTPAVQALDPSVPTQADGVHSSSLPGAEGAEDRAPSTRRQKREGKSVEVLVAEIHAAHPDWGPPRIVEHIGDVKLSTVRVSLARARVRARLVAAEAEPPPPDPNPQTPVAPSPPPIGGTLKDRIRVRHQQHPTWTAVMIAKDLGANPNSVSVYLAAIRREAAGAAVEATPAPAEASTLPNQPAGSIEARLKADAAARKTRLGGKI